jgi:hypothetical protein
MAKRSLDMPRRMGYGSASRGLRGDDLETAGFGRLRGEDGRRDFKGAKG